MWEAVRLKASQPELARPGDAGVLYPENKGIKINQSEPESGSSSTLAAPICISIKSIRGIGYQLHHGGFGDTRHLGYRHVLKNLGDVLADGPGLPAAPALALRYYDFSATRRLTAATR